MLHTFTVDSHTPRLLILFITRARYGYVVVYAFYGTLVDSSYVYVDLHTVRFTFYVCVCDFTLLILVCWLILRYVYDLFLLHHVVARLLFTLHVALLIVVVTFCCAHFTTLLLRCRLHLLRCVWFAFTRWIGYVYVYVALRTLRLFCLHVYGFVGLLLRTF